ncbi:hypothetical protein ACQ4PT_002664 [Festuca glaucescens]
MAPPPPQNWANAPPYLYRGAQQQQQAAPAAEDESDAKSGGDNRSSLRIGRLLDWMDEDYLRSCFTSSPEHYHISYTIQFLAVPASIVSNYMSHFSDFRTQETDSDCNSNTSRLFVGGLDLSVTDEDLKETFSPYGEITDVKVIVGKKYGFVTYLSRASAEEAMRILNGSKLGDKNIRVSWSLRVANQKDQRNGEYHGQPQDSGPVTGWCTKDPNMFHRGYAHYQQQQPQQTMVQKDPELMTSKPPNL